MLTSIFPPGLLGSSTPYRIRESSYTGASGDPLCLYCTVQLPHIATAKKSDSFYILDSQSLYFSDDYVDTESELI